MLQPKLTEDLKDLIVPSEVRSARDTVRPVTGTADGDTPRSAIRTQTRRTWSNAGARFLFARLKRAITQGELVIIDTRGSAHRFGHSGAIPSVTLRFHDAALPWRLIVNTELHFGEAYMSGAVTLESGSVRDLAELAARNIVTGSLLPVRVPAWLRAILRRLQQHNVIQRARANATHHYDQPDRLYELFLDADRQYSCAYFTAPGQTLKAAQENKKRHIAAKLLLAPKMRVLDIGSGWGGLALHLAATTGADVTGLTLSREQLEVARDRAEEAGLQDQVRFYLRDYREETGTFDRIVSVGMFEHVGVSYYRAFFNRIKSLLRPDGVALIHSIGRMDGPGLTSAWIRKHIFPGGYVPALSEVLPVIEQLGLWVTDIEILRLHYAETLKAWSARFQDHRAEIAELYGDSFCRMWELYLASAEMNFRHQNLMVFQIQLARTVDAVPLTRDYMFTAEAAATEGGDDA